MSKAPYADCDNCPLQKKAMAATRVGTPNGNGMRVAIVSRSPGQHDVRVNKPFAGPSGQLLNHLLEPYDLNMNNCLVTNVVLCETEAPSKEAIECCSKRLQHDLETFQPDLILAAGAEAARELTGLKKPIAALRGIKNHSPYGPVVACNNPAAAIRNDGVYPDLVQDFRHAFNPAPEFEPPEVRWTEDIEHVSSYFSAFDAIGTKHVGCDIEASGLTYGSRVICMAIATTQIAFVFGREIVEFMWDDFAPMLDNFMARRDLSFDWHNGQYDTKILRSWGVRARVSNDSQLLHYALDERSDLTLHSLDSCLQEELGWPDYTPEHVSAGKKCGFANITPGQWQDVYQYNGYDAVGVSRLVADLLPKVMV